MANSRYNSLIKFASYKGNQAGLLCKSADDGMLATILNAYKSLDPTAQAAILGGGGGAAIGGLGNALFGNKKRGLLSRLGSGALVGGGLGALGGAGINEAAIRMGMDNKGLNRDEEISMGEAPSHMANDLIGKGYNEYLKPRKPADKG
jgi:hypothetical protein